MKNKDHPKYILSCTDDEKFSVFHNVVRTPDMVGQQLRDKIGIDANAVGKPTRQLQIFSSYPGMMCSDEQLLNVFIHCRIKNEKLIIDRVTEPNILWDGALLSSRSIFDVIHMCLKKSGFDPKNLMLILGSHSGIECYNSWLAHNQIPKQFCFDVIIGYHWLEQIRKINTDARVVHVDKEFDFNKDYIKSGKPKYFTCFNGRLRPSKAKIAEWFFKNGYFTDPILKDTHISTYCFQNINHKHEYYINNTEMFKVLPRNLESEHSVRYADDSDAPDTEEYENAQRSAYFDLVIDYLQHEDWAKFDTEYQEMRAKNPWWHEWTISEKLYKNLFSKRPFLTLCEPGSLNFLHNLGFKTFPFLFDESYDTIENFELRKRAVLSEVKRITTKMSKQELHTIIYSDQCQEVLEHNREHGKKVSEDARQEFAYSIHRFMFK